MYVLYVFTCIFTDNLHFNEKIVSSDLSEEESLYQPVSTMVGTFKHSLFGTLE